MSAAGDIKLTVFTKPWKMPLPELAAYVKRLGLDGIELPVRPGFQVTPEDVSRGLPEAARIMADHGLTIASIAGPTNEATFAACAEAGIPLIRILLEIPQGVSYLDYEANIQREFDALIPLLERYNVAIGIQNESGRCVANAMGIRHLIERYDRKHIGAILDPAHCALNGEVPELALDIAWSHLHMVNLKNVYWRRSNIPEAGPVAQGTSPVPGAAPVAAWEPYWSTGREGLVSWATVASELRGRGYRGAVCLTAEYTDEAAVDQLIAEDAAYARSLFAGSPQAVTAGGAREERGPSKPTWSIRQMLGRIRSAFKTDGRRIVVLVPDPHYDRVLSGEARVRLEKLGRVVRPASTSEALAPRLAEILANADVAVTGWGTPTLPISSLPQDARLKLIVHTAGSVRHLIPPEAYSRGIQVAHAAPVIADAVTEFTLLFMLEGLRRAGEMDRRMRAGLPFQDAGSVYQGDLLSHRHVGLVGAGYVGRRVIKALKPLAASVSVYDPYLSPSDASQLGVQLKDLERLFAECSIVSVHTPQIQETHNMIGAHHLSLLPDGAIFVNTARAWSVDQAALLDELRRGRIWAALDVFDPEPVPVDSPLRSMENVLLTPHVAGRSLTTLRRQGEAMVEEIERWSRGESLRFAVTEAMLSTMA